MEAPIKLTGFNVSGFAMHNALAGDSVNVLHRAALISDEPEFYHYIHSITGMLTSRALTAGVVLVPGRVSNFLLVIHEDESADLYLDPGTLAEVMAKRDMEAGAVVMLNQIADVRTIRFPQVEFKASDKVVACLKIGWKFGLFFDLGDARHLDVVEMERVLARLYRTLLFQDAYEALSSDESFSALVAEGWFPFIEILGGEFETLLKAYRDKFNTKGAQDSLVSHFDGTRVDQMANRWWRRSSLAGRQQILQSAIDAFKRQDPVAALKTSLTEIEGILRDAHIAEVGKGASMKELLAYLADHGLKRTGTETSLFFPQQFIRYLSDHVYARFDQVAGTGVMSGRHAVSHGGAQSDVYTQRGALQALLVLDQISFYLN